jgi:uncharacterized membrane protein YvlD (DUF360 family)
MTWEKTLLRIVLAWIVEAIGLYILSRVTPGVHIKGFAAALAIVLFIGIVNAIVWPLLSYFLLRYMVFTLGLLTLVLNGLIFWAASQVLPGFSIIGFGPYIVLVIGMTVFSTLVSALLTLDDENPYYRNVVLRLARRKSHIQMDPAEANIPGVFFLEIDGLAAPIMMRAVTNGYLPTLSRWLEEGTHRLMQWEPDLSSQTAASQAGILLGDNTDIPAFRWYERESGRIMVSSKPAVASEVETRESTGHGLLEGQGTSRNNMFSGDAPVSMFTMSKVLESRRADIDNYYAFFAYPFNAVRLLVLFFGEVFREIWQRRKQKRRNVRPRLDHRGKAYPFVRAATTILMRDLTIYALLEDMYAGVPVSYATFVGYDEVAHHSGIERAETMHTLAQLDRQFGRLERASKIARRPYKFVVLSDHGQTQGATFKMRQGYSLEDLVCKLVESGTDVQRPTETSEGWGQINAALTEGVHGDGKSLTAKAVKRGVSKRTYEEGVVLGPEHHDVDQNSGALEKPDGDILVMGSGNLGLIYFRASDHRLTLEEIDVAHPRLIEGLVEHDGIGFVLVRSDAHGAVAIGKAGVHFLDEDRVEGEDPIAVFGPNAPDHLKRTDSFRDVADIMVNSFYDPVWEEVSAFEELVSCHGGLGGTQTEPFVLYPSEWPSPAGEVVGAAALHKVLKDWVKLEQDGSTQGPDGNAVVKHQGLPAPSTGEVGV